MNPTTGLLEETAKIEEKIESTTPTAQRTESLNKKPDTKVAPKIADQKIFEKNINNKISSIDYINRMQYMYNEQPLNESNKMKDAALAAANKRNNVDPNRPAFSDSDVVFASMDPQEALRFTGGHDKKKIKFMREVKAKVHAQDAYDKKKKSLADMPVRKAPIVKQPSKELDMYKGVIDSEPVRPNFAKRRDPDLDRGVASLFKKRL